MQKTLLSTVGTSLIGNLSRLEPKKKLEEELKEAYEKEKWEQVAQKLRKFPPNERICGAEINTIYELIINSKEDIANMYFLVSDTKEGEIIGKILIKYFKNNPEFPSIKQVGYEKIEALQDKDPKKFKNQGLRNLVKVISKYIEKVGKEHILIDATGGYKAQIAVAVLMGQALEIPVYYKHERFGNIISFPPLPVSLDYSLIGKYPDIFREAYNKLIINLSSEGLPDERLKVFFECIEEGNEIACELTAIGEIYIQSFYHRNINTLKKVPDNERKHPDENFGVNHHYEKGFKELIRKIWEENKWIKTIRPRSYDKQKSIKKGIHFNIQQDGETYKLIGTYKPDDFGNRFEIVANLNNVEELSYAVLRLTDKYSDS